MSLADARPSMLDEVREGLGRPQKELSPKFFYDTRGSELFEAITGLPEYYLTRTERALLETHAPVWTAEMAPRSLVELGAGSARKTRVLLDAMEAERPGNLYVPVDVSREFLQATADRLRDAYPRLDVRPRVADLTEHLPFPADLPTPTLFALLGSTIGNFAAGAAVRLLRHVREAMGPTDRFLLGVDLRPGPRKSVARLEAAYDDDAGVTAAFNLNILSVLNREVGTDFDPAAYHHRAFWNAEEGRIEMHLVARRRQRVRFPDGASVDIDAGESIRTEISCKYDRSGVEDLFDPAGLRVHAWLQDTEDLFALVLADPA